MMIKIEAIVREEVFEDVKEALNKIEVNGITVSQVMGCGAQRGYKLSLKLSYPQKNGSRKPLLRFRKPLSQAKSVTARFSVMRFARP